MITLFTFSISHSATSIWTGAGAPNLSWNNPTNWQGNVLPDFDDTDGTVDDIVFGTNTADNSTTTVDGDKTINSLRFSSTNGIRYVISNGTLRIKTGTIIRDYNCLISTQTIACTVILLTNGVISMSGNNNSGSRLHINGAIQDNGQGFGLWVNGARVVELNGFNSFSGPLVVGLSAAATLRLTGSNALSSLSLTNGCNGVEVNSPLPNCTNIFFEPGTIAHQSPPHQ